MSSPLATLTARDLTVAAGARLLLGGVDLVLAPGARLGLVGPNGSGKTTLLQVLAGLRPADGGRVRLSPPTASVGYLPQEPAPRPGETVRAMLARRTGVAEASAALDAATTALGTDDDADGYTAALDRWMALGGAGAPGQHGPHGLARPGRRLLGQVADRGGGRGQPHPAAVGGPQPGQHPQQGGLARPVGPDQAQPGAGGEHQVDAAEQQAGAGGDGQVAGSEGGERRRHGTPGVDGERTRWAGAVVTTSGPGYRVRASSRSVIPTSPE